MTGADAYLKAMMKDAEWNGVPVDWSGIDRIIDFTHKNIESVRCEAPERNPMTHPLQHDISIAQDMIDALTTAAETLADAIASEKYARQAAQEAKNALAAAEAELIADEVVASLAGEGALAGIARTSKAYDAALDALKVRGYRNGLAACAMEATDAQRVAVNASIAFDQATVRFSALRHASELQAAILRAALL